MNIFQELLGKKITDEIFVQFQNQLNSEVTKRENNSLVNGKKEYDYDLLYKEIGILFTFLKDEIISIKVFFSPTPITQPFRGEFVFGLSHISSENDIKKQFNFPKNLNQEPMRADNIYLHENILVAFDAMTGEINYAVINL